MGSLASSQVSHEKLSVDPYKAKRMWTDCVQSPVLGTVKGKVPEKEAEEKSGRIKGRKAEGTVSWKEGKQNS